MQLLRQVENRAHARPAYLPFPHWLLVDEFVAEQEFCCIAARCCVSPLSCFLLYIFSSFYFLTSISTASLSSPSLSTPSTTVFSDKEHFHSFISCFWCPFHPSFTSLNPEEHHRDYSGLIYVSYWCLSWKSKDSLIIIDLLAHIIAMKWNVFITLKVIPLSCSEMAFHALF